MSETARVIRRRGRLFCPHCKIFIGEAKDGAFVTGFVRLVGKAHPIECAKCNQRSLFFNECWEKRCDNSPAIGSDELRNKLTGSINEQS